jgi:hypothetical protein
MLLGGYSVLSKHPGRDIGGGATGLGMNRGDFNKTSQTRGAFTSGNWQPKSGIPDGYRPHYSWALPLKAGALASRNLILGEGDATISMAGGLNGEATLEGEGTLVGVGQLIISMVAALTGSGAITNADADAFLQLAASLAGAGDLDGALTAIGHAAAALSGDGDATGTATALGTLAASLTVTGDLLTSANVAAAILDAVDGIESDVTLREAIRLILAAAAGKVSISGNTVTFRNAVADDTDRIVATTTTEGERTAIIYDTA